MRIVGARVVGLRGIASRRHVTAREAPRLSQMTSCRHRLQAVAATLAGVLFVGACVAPGVAPGSQGAPVSGSGSTTRTSASSGPAPTSNGSTQTGSLASTSGLGGSSPTTGLLGRGQERPAAEIPWSQVGRNWSVALWTGAASSTAEAPVSLFVVNPVGGRYLVRTWPASPSWRQIVDWSGDGRRVLVGGDQLEVVDVSTGESRALPGIPDGEGAGFTRPAGRNVLVTLFRPGNGHEIDTLTRVDLAGAHPVALVPGIRAWVFAPDGRSLVLDGQGALPVIDTAGRSLGAIPTPSGRSCRPIRWWADRRLLVACGTFELWLLSPSGGAPQQLTVTPPLTASPMTFGNGDVYAVGHDLYVQAEGPCGGEYLARVNADGTTRAVAVPGAASGLRQHLLGTDGSARLALLATMSCEVVHRSPSVFWFNPSTGQVDVLLGPGLNGGRVLDARLFSVEPSSR